MLRHTLIAKIAAGVIGTVVIAGGGIALASTTFSTDEPSATVEDEQPDDTGQQGEDGQDGTACDDASEAYADDHGDNADEPGEDADEQGEDCDEGEDQGDAEGEDQGDDDSSPAATPTQD